MVENKYPKRIGWRCHTANLLKEIVNNNDTTGCLAIPVQLFAGILSEVSERASQLNDPKLNALMCRLTLYEIADPESKEYNRELTERIIKNADEPAPTPEQLLANNEHLYGKKPKSAPDKVKRYHNESQADKRRRF